MTSSTLKKLVMKLACANLEDREWILMRLNPVESEKVISLLREAESLGLASDPSIVAAVMQNAVEPPKSVLEMPNPIWSALLEGRFPANRTPKGVDFVDVGVPNDGKSEFTASTLPAALEKCLREQLVRGDFQ